MKTAWKTFGNSYVIAAGQTVVRFKIKATVYAAASQGNLVDNISMEYAECSNAIMSANVMAQEANTSSEQAMVSVLPNPVTSTAEISLKGFENGDVNLMVTDATGKMLNSLKYSYNSGTSHNIDLTGLKPGFYLIKVTQNGKSAIAKVLKK